MLTTEHLRDSGRFAIDPFAGAPDAASRIEGLGEGRAAGEPGHVFRTLPIMAVPGAAAFTIAFDALAADAGRLHIELTAKGQGEAVAPVREKTLVVPLVQLARRGGAATLAFEAHPNMLYALTGSLIEGRGARAGGLRITLATGDAVPLAGEATDAVEPVALPRLVGLDEPDFGEPVSQPMTPRQQRHPAYRRQAARLGGDASWAGAYVLQALERYGAARPGARGLALADRGEAVARALAAGGCAVHRHDPAAANPGDHDFAWSIASEGDAAALERRVWAGVDRVAPGGIGVHVFPHRPAGGRAGPGLSRVEIERLALNIISFGREVAQLKFRTPVTDPVVPYALIVRREEAA